MKKQINNIFTDIPKTLLNLISSVMVNGVVYKNLKDWCANIVEGENIIIINPLSSTNRKVIVKEVALHDTPYFKFNELYNNNNPIPMVEMYGVLLEEKDKTVKMDLWDKEHKVHWSGWLLRSWILEW